LIFRPAQQIFPKSANDSSIMASLIRRAAAAGCASSTSSSSPLLTACRLPSTAAASSSSSFFSTTSSSFAAAAYFSSARAEPVRVKRAVSVVLRQQLDTLGHAGEEVKVAPGHARNYLVPHGLAVYATVANKAAHKVVLAPEEAAAKADERARNRVRTRIEAVSLRFQRATRDGAQLYGGVSAADIVEGLETTPLANLRIRPANVKIGGDEKGAITAVGWHTVEVEPARSFAGLWCQLKVEVVSS
jgi:ribosomal protein L9